MKRTVLKRASAVLLSVLCLSLFVLPFSVFAAEGTTTMTFSATNVYIGNNVTVTLKMSSSTPMAVWSLSLQYDTSCLQYVSGADSTSGNRLNFLNTPQSGGVTSKTYSATFKTTALGNPSFTAVTSGVYSESYSPITFSNVTRSINIIQRPAASSENRLSALSVEGGELSPAFDQDTTEYTLSVPYSTSSLNISATTKHGSAYTIVSGAEELAVGENTVSVLVVAESGARKTYTVKVTRADSAFVGAEVAQSDATGTFPRDVSEVKDLPRGFSPAEGKYREQTVLVFKNPEKSATLAVLFGTDAEGETTQQFYLYDESDESFTRFVSVETAPRNFIFLQKPDSLKLPEGFSETILLVHEIEVEAWLSAETGETLVYATPVDGVAALYVYDAQNALFELYHASADSAPVPEGGAVTSPEIGAGEIVAVGGDPAELETVKGENAFLKQLIFWGLIVAGGILLLLLILLIIFIVLAARRKRDLLERGEPRPDLPPVAFENGVLAVPAAEETEPVSQDTVTIPSTDSEAPEQDVSSAAFVLPVPTEELLAEVEPEPEFVEFPEEEEFETETEPLAESEPVAEPESVVESASAPIAEAAVAAGILSAEVLAAAEPEPMPQITKEPAPMIWDELAATREDEPLEILAPSRTRRDVVRPAPMAEPAPEVRRGHPEVERVFRGESDEALFRKNNPLYDEDEDENDAPIFGFDED